MSAPASPSADPLPASAGDAVLQPGACWLGRYQITSAGRSAGGQSLFLGTRVADGAAVALREVPNGSCHPTRPEVWRRLRERSLSGFAELLERVPQAAGPVEVWRVPAGPSLAEWRRGHEPSRTTVAALARQLAQLLLDLHERQVALVNLSAETVMLAAEDPLTVAATSLDHAVALPTTAAVHLPSDPSLTAPEGLGQNELPAEARLYAWDWWTLGRLLQEMILGEPVTVRLAGGGVGRQSGQARQEAVALLEEAGTHDCRAGAVELLPELPAELARLLRGLLTTVAQARWSDAEVRAWLAGESPAEHYELLRGTFLVQHQGRTLPLPELARWFGQEEGWSEGVAQFAALEPEPGSPAEVLLRDEPGLEAERDWFRKVREIRDAAALRPFGADARNEALAAVAWAGVAPAGTRLRWRGRLLDLPLMQELVAHPAQLDRVRVLCVRAVVDLIQQRDAATARALRTWGYEWEDALGTAERQRWAPTAALRCRLARRVFAPAEERAQILKAGHEAYHLTSLAPLQALFSAERVSPGQAALLAYTLEMPEKFGYVTHDQWRKSEQLRLRARGEDLLGALRAYRARCAVVAAPVLFAGAARWWTASLLVLLLTAAAWPGVVGSSLALGLLATGVLVRWRWGRHVRQLAPPPEGERWRWSRACDLLATTAHRLAALNERVRPSALRQELERVNRELTALPLSPAPAAVVGRSAPLGLWCTGVTAWLLLAGLLVLVGWRGFDRPWTPQGVLDAWSGDLTDVSAAFAQVQEAPLPELGQRARPKWPFVASAVTHPLEVIGRGEAGQPQLIAMKTFHLSLQEHYDPATLQGLVATTVGAGEEAGITLMLIDLASGQLPSATMYRVAQPPIRGMWIELDGIPALYLDGP